MGARYDHLTLDERRLIYQLREARLGVPRIAERLGRHRSTIYRELRRNWHRDAEIKEMNGYYPTVAHGGAARRRYRLGKLQQNSTLATLVVERLSLAWSPEQIAGRLRLDEPHGTTICHETIYRFVYGPQGRADELYRLLPSRRRCRRTRCTRKPKTCLFQKKIRSGDGLKASRPSPNYLEVFLIDSPELSNVIGSKATPFSVHRSRASALQSCGSTGQHGGSGFPHHSCD